MINRFFAIKYPSNANLFNLNGINGGNVVESWAMVAQRFKGVPRWFYTKTKKAPKKQVDRYTPNDASIEIYLSKNEIGMREFNDLKLYAKEELFNDLQKIEAQIYVYRK